MVSINRVRGDDNCVSELNVLLPRYIYSDPNVPEQINETVMSYWEPMTSDNIEYLKIDINGTMETGLYKKVYPFWRSLPLFSKYFN